MTFSCFKTLWWLLITFRIISKLLSKDPPGYSFVLPPCPHLPLVPLFSPSHLHWSCCFFNLPCSFLPSPSFNLVHFCATCQNSPLGLLKYQLLKDAFIPLLLNFAFIFLLISTKHTFVSSLPWTHHSMISLAPLNRPEMEWRWVLLTFCRDYMTDTRRFWINIEWMNEQTTFPRLQALNKS